MNNFFCSLVCIFLVKSGGKMTSRQKIFIFDYIRIISAFFVFLFHSNLHLGISYGIITPFISVGAIFMTAFFMLSGASLAYNYESKELLTYSEYIKFIKKRIISIYPGYLVLIVLFFVKLLITKNFQLGIVQHIVILPIELSLLQSVFGNSYSVLHNSGTWFISCILLCYLLFPFLCKLIMQLEIKQLLTIIIIFFCILAWSPIVEKILSLSWIYPNPFFRIVNFSLGICIIRFYKLITPPRTKV